MKRLILAVAMCCAFSMYGLATNSDPKLKRIEMLEKKINALKDERANIENKLPPIHDEMRVTIKKAMALKDKIINLQRNVFFGVPYYKALIEKKENDIKILTLRATE
ncbi:MAG: hypothetical protein LBK92_01170, partial [Endomicrobium sp.]|nr:hypothetical protein [Endomicrobium sp.]